MSGRGCEPPRPVHGFESGAAVGCRHQQIDSLKLPDGSIFKPLNVLAYVAGLLDGDGSISLRSDQRLIVRIGLNVSAEVIALFEWLKKHWGGSVHFCAPTAADRVAVDAATLENLLRTSRGGPNRASWSRLSGDGNGLDGRTKATWTLQGEGAARLLAHVHPFVKLKRRRIDVQLRVHQLCFRKPSRIRASLIPLLVGQCLATAGRERRPLTLHEHRECLRVLDQQGAPTLKEALTASGCDEMWVPRMTPRAATPYRAAARSVEVSYAAGLFDAEGSATVHVERRATSTGWATLSVKFQVTWSQLDADQLWPHISRLWDGPARTARPGPGLRQYVLQGEPALLAALEMHQTVVVKRSQLALIARALAPGRALEGSTLRDDDVLRVVGAALRSAKQHTSQRVSVRLRPLAEVDEQLAAGHKALTRAGVPPLERLIAWAAECPLAADAQGVRKRRRLAPLPTKPRRRPRIGHLTVRDGRPVHLVLGATAGETQPLFPRGGGAARLAAALIQNVGPVTMAEAYELLWPEGGHPATAANTLRVQIKTVRDRVRPFGLTVSAERGRGYVMHAVVPG